LIPLSVIPLSGTFCSLLFWGHADAERLRKSKWMVVFFGRTLCIHLWECTYITSSIPYCYNLVYVISFSMSQSDHIKRLLLYYYKVKILKNTLYAFVRVDCVTSSIPYCYNLVHVISFSMPQSDRIKRLLLF
jgi:hypothetical protein